VSFGIAIQLGAVGNALALDGHRRITQYAQTHFAAHDGMPHSLANAIAQTADGYLWITSQDGLSGFDGASFTTYDHQTTEAIPVSQASTGCATATCYRSASAKGWPTRSSADSARTPALRASAMTTRPTSPRM
jgi:hypothetical protein